MAVNVVFYYFNKKINSTKRPDSDTDSVTYACNMLDDCSIINPKISIAGADNTFNPRRYNYAYIADFDRWYFVSDWVYSQRIWNAMLSVDVLASWRNGIGNSVQYITRGSNDILKSVGDRFQDAQYPASVIYNSQAIDYTDPIGGALNGGCIILGVLGDQQSKFGATYYAFLPSSFQSFISILFSSNIWTTLLNSLNDPLQYIISCKWVPVDYTVFAAEDTQTNGVYVGNTLVLLPNSSVCYIIKDPVKTITRTFTLSQHPLKSRGLYLSTSPFTIRSFYWAPVGEVELDTSILSNSASAKMRFYIDVVTGQCIYDIRRPDYADGTPGNIVAKGNSKCAAELPLSHITVDAMGVASGIISMATASFSGNIAGMASSAISMGGSMIPRVSQSGGVGSFAAYFKSRPAIISDFYHQANIWPERFGWYTGGIYDTISNYPGYIKTENADIQIAGTDDEISKINDFMNGGFYYE